MTAVCYSYVRFSSPEQAKGDSLRRQTEAANEWAKRNGLRLDTSLTLHDLGRSAFRGAHRSDPNRHALAGFLALIERGRIAKGSYLIVENMDRLSRENPVHAIHLLSGILVAGVQVVQLRPNELILTDRSNLFELLQGQMNQERGHNESQMKSERVGAAWAEKKEAAREGREQPPRKKDGRRTMSLTNRLPAWIGDRNGKLVLIPEKAAAVRRIYDLAAAGYGARAIVRRLTNDGVPPIGSGSKGHPPRWVPAYVQNILNDRRAVGELQPRKGGEPDGPPVPDYFPAVVTEAEWATARAEATRRIKRPGRPSYHQNVFQGLLRNARDGEAYTAMTRVSHGRRSRVLVALSGLHGRSSQFGFPFEVFELVVLGALKEVDPKEVLGQEDGPDEVRSLSDQLTTLESRLSAIEDQIVEGGDVTVLTNASRRLEEQKRLVVEKLTEARAKAARPLSEAWGETKSLLSVLHPDAPGDARTRLQAAIRRVVESIYILVLPQGLTRHAIVQVFFKDSPHRRLYTIHYQAAHGPTGRSSTWEADSLTGGLTDATDLRDRTTWGKWWWALLV